MVFDPGGNKFHEAVDWDELDQMNESEDFLLCMEAALSVMSQECIRMGVFREGEFSINKSAVKMFNVLFDTGALQRSYISKELVDAHRSQWRNAIKHSPSVVRLADQVSRKNTSELVIGTIGFIDDNGREFRAVVEAIVWEMPKMDFILGLPDILRNFLDIFVKMLRDTERTLNEVDI